MKSIGSLLVTLTFTSAMFAAPFKPVAPGDLNGEPYGVGTRSWRFASSLSQEATGAIEVCYVETGSAERVVGRVDVRPFRTSRTELPDLRILFATTEVDGRKRIVLIVGYGIRSGVFVVEVPGLTEHSLVGGASIAGPSGEYNLLGWGDSGVTLLRDGRMTGERGRLFFRYVGTK